MGEVYYVHKVDNSTLKLALSGASLASDDYVSLGYQQQASSFRLRAVNELAYTQGRQVIDVVNDEIHFTEQHGLQSNQRVGYYRVNDSGVVGGLSSGGYYYVKRVDAYSLQLLESPAGAVVDLTADASGESVLEHDEADFDEMKWALGEDGKLDGV